MKKSIIFTVLIAQMGLLYSAEGGPAETGKYSKKEIDCFIATARAILSTNNVPEAMKEAQVLPQAEQLCREHDNPTIRAQRVAHYDYMRTIVQDPNISDETVCQIRDKWITKATIQKMVADYNERETRIQPLLEQASKALQQVRSQKRFDLTKAALALALKIQLRSKL